MEKHLLIKYGVLRQFSIRKSVSAKKLSIACKKLALTCKSESEFKDKVRSIIEDINPASVPGTIPISEGEKKNNYLNVVTNNIIQYFLNQRVKSDEIIMVLNAIAYAVENDTVPFFEFYDDDGNPTDDLDDDDSDESPY